MIIIGICGDACSGKTWFSSKLAKICSKQCVEIISEEYFYDTNDSRIDFNEAKETLEKIKGHKTIKLQSSDNEIVTIDAPDILIITGMYIFQEEELRNLFHLKIFLDIPHETRLYNLMRRYCGDYSQFSKYISDVHVLKVGQAKKWADFSITNYENDLIVKMIEIFIHAQINPENVFND